MRLFINLWQIMYESHHTVGGTHKFLDIQGKANLENIHEVFQIIFCVFRGRFSSQGKMKDSLKLIILKTWKLENILKVWSFKELRLLLGSVGAVLNLDIS